MEVNGTQGKFDFIKIDSANNRLLACHTGNGSLDVIDLITSKLIMSIPTGNAQGSSLRAPRSGARSGTLRLWLVAVKAHLDFQRHFFVARSNDRPALHL